MPAPPVAANHRDERIGKTFTGGVFASRFVYTEAIEGSPGFEWNFIGLLNNRNTLTSRSENCAGYFQARRHKDGSTWALCVEACDESFGVHYGPQVSIEADQWCNGADPYRWRIGLHVVAGDARRIRTGEARNEFCEVGYGILLSNNGADWNARFRDGIKIKNFWDSAVAIDGAEDDKLDPAHHIFRFKGRFITGFSFVEAQFERSPIRLGREQTIALEGTESVTVGLHGDRVEIRMVGKPVFAVDIHTGDIYARGELRKM